MKTSLNILTLLFIISGITSCSYVEEDDDGPKISVTVSVRNIDNY